MSEIQTSITQPNCIFSRSLFVISAPSGTGKTTIKRELERKYPKIRFSVSCTTRKRRPDEMDGRDYFFLDEKDFRLGIRRGRFLEWANVFGNFYGTDRKHIEKLINSGFDVVLDIDVQGARQVRAMVKDIVTIFVLPPSFEALEERLKKRGTESEEVLQTRLQGARWEVSQAPWFDYIVVNEVLEKAVSQIGAIIIATRCRRDHALGVLKGFPDIVPSGQEDCT